MGLWDDMTRLDAISKDDVAGLIATAFGSGTGLFRRGMVRMSKH